MKRKIYLTILFSGIAGIAAVGASQRAEGSHTETAVPELWRGTWQVSVSHHDPQTGALMLLDSTTTVMCPGEPIVPPMFHTRMSCSEEASEDGIGFSCYAKHSPEHGCNVFAEAALESKRDGDTWSGTGSWNAKVVGNCEHHDFGANMIVTGRRISSEAACDTNNSSLLERFFTHGAFRSLQ